jgi:hypothetical protein
MLFFFLLTPLSSQVRRAVRHDHRAHRPVRAPRASMTAAYQALGRLADALGWLVG